MRGRYPGGGWSSPGGGVAPGAPVWSQTAGIRARDVRFGTKPRSPAGQNPSTTPVDHTGCPQPVASSQRPRRSRRYACGVDIGQCGAIRGEVRLAGYRRVLHGLYLPTIDGLSEAQEFARDLQAILLVLPDGAVYTHLTGARVRGWRLPALPEQVPVFAAVRGDRRPRRPGLVCSRLTHGVPPTMIWGLPVDSPEEILLRAARDLGVLDLAIMLDSALHLGDLDPSRMETLLASSRPGVVRLRRAWDLRDAKAESAGETVLRVFHAAMDVPVMSQVDIHDDDGRLLARADLIIRGTYQLREYDGAVHREKRQQWKDLRRSRGLNGTPYERSGFTLDDLLNHPGVLMHELDRLLGRPHRMARLSRWKALVADSLYSEATRRRLLTRWRRVMGGVDWLPTARARG